jgi:hypothetical protein
MMYAMDRATSSTLSYDSYSLRASSISRTHAGPVTQAQINGCIANNRNPEVKTHKPTPRRLTTILIIPNRSMYRYPCQSMPMRHLYLCGIDVNQLLFRCLKCISITDIGFVNEILFACAAFCMSLTTDLKCVRAISRR